MRRPSPLVCVALVVGCSPASSSRPDASASGAEAPSGPYLVVTTLTSHFQISNIAATEAAAPTTVVDVGVTTSTLQAVTGFGGAFNEKGWAALSALGADVRETVVAALFDPTTGLRFRYGRVPIGASDYALDRYTDDETAGDYAMTHFGIDRDRQSLIPYIHDAMKYQPGLRVWGSAWTPPTWMKTNAAFDAAVNQGAMRDDPQIYDAYALYLARFVEAYRAEGIDLFMVVPQNEPTAVTNYPSCVWTPAQYDTFLRDHAGPLFAQRRPGAELWVGTINDHAFDTSVALGDPAALPYLGGLTLQWDGFGRLAMDHAAYPDLPVMQSETDCGNHPWEAGFDPNLPPNDFAYAAMTWHKMHDWFEGGVSSYMIWNMVLDQEGKNIDSVLPWPQNSAVVVDTVQRSVTYTPMYWAVKHFSGLVDVGAHLLQTSPATDGAIAFQNPDGAAVVELLNDGAGPQSVAVQVGGQVFSALLPAQSFGTLVVPSPQWAATAPVGGEPL